MLLRRFTDYILENRYRTMAIVFAIAFVPLIGSISILIAAFVTLRRGAKEGFYILLATILPLLIGMALSPAASSTSDIQSVDIVILMIANNVLTWLFAVVLRKYASWSLLIQLAALICIAGVVALHLIYPDMQAWWQKNLTEFLLYTLQVSNHIPASDLLAQKVQIGRMVEVLSAYATGFVEISVVFYALVQVLLARWWQAALYNPGGLRKELVDIRLSYAAGFIFILEAGLLFTHNATVIDLLSILLLTFALAGFSILHTVMSLSKSSWFWIGLIYIGVVLAPQVIVIIAVLGLLDTFFNIRKQLSKRRV